MSAELDELVNKTRPRRHACHIDTAAAGNGNKLINYDKKDVYTFDIAGTSTAQVYEFRGIGPLGNDNLVTCYRQGDSFGATGTSVKGETWQAPIKGLKEFYVKIISITGKSAVEGDVENG